ncbi:MAG: creatininase family protein [Candidatus Freyarchaeota archaeon]
MPPQTFPLENLTWKELDSLDREKTVILVPVAPLEQHGPHLPIGTDFLECRFLARMIGEKIKDELKDYNVLIHPAIPVGTGTLDKPGTIEFRAKTVKSIVYDLGESLAVHGFRHIVVIACHGAPTFMGYFLSLLFEERVEELPEELGQMVERFPKDYHAGYIETSMMLNIDENLVKKDYKTYEPIEVKIIKLKNRKVVDKHGKGIGYFGYPAEASKQLGEKILDSTVNLLTEIIIHFLKRENYKKYMHSAYWKIPSFRTNPK